MLKLQNAKKKPLSFIQNLRAIIYFINIKRVTRFERATFSLARRHSTTELYPQKINRTLSEERARLLEIIIKRNSLSNYASTEGASTAAKSRGKL